MASMGNETELETTDDSMPDEACEESVLAFRDLRRNEALRRCRHVAGRVLTAKWGITQFKTLLRNKEFAASLFNLFDVDEHGAIKQEELFELLRINVRHDHFSHANLEFRADVVDLLESVCYVICQDEDISIDSFHRIVSSRSVPEKLFRLANPRATSTASSASSSSLEMTVDDLLNFLIILSTPKPKDDAIGLEEVKRLEWVFKQSLPPRRDELTIDDFRRIMPNRNAFFLERTFDILDRDGNGKISLTEFVDAMYQFSRQGPAEKLLFLFKIYDIDGDGRLQEDEIEQVLRACVAESGMELPESDIEALAVALFHEARDDDVAQTNANHIGIEQLKKVFAKHPGIIDNLNFSLSTWLLPDKVGLGPHGRRLTSTSMGGSDMSTWTILRSRFALKHALNQWQFFTFMAVLLVVHLVLFVSRACEFVTMHNADGSQPNFFYMTSRGCGRCLLLDSVLIVVLVLRYTITKLRIMGAGSFLPLDNNIYLHKLIGVVIFVFSWVHTIMHVCNFSLNVQPDPLKFVQLNSKFWDVSLYIADDADEVKPKWQKLGYNVPSGCSVVPCNRTDIAVAANITKMCQFCNATGKPWTIVDWLFTTKPGVFGLFGGLANPSGFGLIVVVSVMTLCSVPFVRKSGYFQVFYFSHLMYWAYIILLVLHAPTFWQWILVPLTVLIVEKIYRGASTMAGRGKTVITEGMTMASRVTRLEIRRPFHFKYSPGDWVFVRIPKEGRGDTWHTIATSEWHPFTISSAPEDGDVITLHVRGIGNWTNKVYEYYEEKRRQRGRHVRQIARGEIGSVDLLNLNYGLQFDVTTNIIVPTYAPSEKKLEIYLDGPFGAPASDFFRAEHAVFIATGIGVTPFSSILQSIMHRYLQARRVCPKCGHKWTSNPAQIMSLKKVDFFWINRDQKSFEWFVTLLDKMEKEQEAVMEGNKGDMNRGNPNKFLDIHLFFTSALQRSDIRAVALQLAMDILHKKENRDVMTKLKVRTNAGRPNWNKVFPKLQDERRGKVTVFYCGTPHLAKVLRKKCEDFGFSFRKETF